MASLSLLALEDGVTEVRHLRDAMPRGTAGPGLALTRALGRSAVVLLSSHLEAYISSVNLEAVSAVNSLPLAPDKLEVSLRLLHSRYGVERLEETVWNGAPRERQLAAFVQTDAWLWETGRAGALDPDRLLMWMKSPKPERLMKYFRYWGIDNIFVSVTRTTHTQDEMFRRLQDLVDKRNSIAHGDIGTSASRDDLSAYIRSVREFASRADGVFARRLAVICGMARPW